MSPLIAPSAPYPQASVPSIAGPTLLDRPESLIDPVDGVFYPETDGIPMPGNDLGDDLYHHLKDAIRYRFRNEPLIYVAGNNFFYPERGKPRNNFSPDVYVVEGVEKRPRIWFKAFEEPPHRLLFVAEVVSPSTFREDTNPKRKPAKYAALGFREYFQVDPFGDLLPSPVLGYRLENGKYLPIPPSPTGAVHSETLGLDFIPSSGLLRVVDPRTGWFIDYDEIHALWDPLHAKLDHNYLNDVEGLSNPTSENLARWIWEAMKPALPQLVQITVFETCDARCEYAGD